MFDPYHKWLGIPPEHQPPDHYRLLGLQQFEADPDVIEAAGERQMAHVQNYKLGPQSQLSQRILNEISRAKVCLLNPSTKADYDARLRRNMGQPKTANASPPVTPPPPPVYNEPAAEPTRPAAPTSRVQESPPATAAARSPIAEVEVFRPRHVITPRRRKNNLSVIILGCFVATLAGVVGFALLDQNNSPLAKKSDIETLPSKSTAPARAEDTTKSSRRAAPLSPRDSQAEGPKSNNNTSPTLANRRQQSGRQASEIKLEVVESAGNHENKPPATDTSARAVGQAAISKPAMTDLKDAAVSEKQVREAVEIEATIIDLTKTSSTIKINVAKEGIEPRQLRFEAIEVTNSPFIKRLPVDGQAAHGEPVRLIVRDELPKAAIELSLHGIQPLSIRVKPIIEDYDHKLYPWTQSRMKTLRAVLIHETKKAETGISNLKSRIPQIQATIETLKRQPRNIYNREALAANQRTAEASLAEATSELKRLEARLPLLKTQAEGFTELFALSERVHLQGRVRFRVLHQIGDEVTTVAQTAGL